mmetsp:Transcript_1153/g.3566  ORF Transcript_1153/g.3566 Transcript_1153/m.3566 type:complete len:392 (+) Transcript_1153:959-2134(+)
MQSGRAACRRTAFPSARCARRSTPADLAGCRRCRGTSGGSWTGSASVGRPGARARAAGSSAGLTTRPSERGRASARPRRVGASPSLTRPAYSSAYFPVWVSPTATRCASNLQCFARGKKESMHSRMIDRSEKKRPVEAAGHADAVNGHATDLPHGPGVQHEQGARPIALDQAAQYHAVVLVHAAGTGHEARLAGQGPGLVPKQAGRRFQVVPDQRVRNVRRPYRPRYPHVAVLAPPHAGRHGGKVRKPAKVPRLVLGEWAEIPRRGSPTALLSCVLRIFLERDASQARWREFGAARFAGPHSDRLQPKVLHDVRVVIHARVQVQQGSCSLALDVRIRPVKHEERVQARNRADLGLPVAGGAPQFDNVQRRAILGNPVHEQVRPLAPQGQRG